MSNFKKFNPDYRQALHNMSKEKGFNNSTYFNEVSSSIPNSLRRFSLPNSPSQDLNCHSFTFGGNSRITPATVYQKMQSGVIRKIGIPTTGCIIIYMEENNSRPFPIIKHSGIYLGGGWVRSKWNKGPVFEHKVFDIPSDYGDQVKFFEH